MFLATTGVLTLCEGGRKIFEKGHSNKMIKFLLIVFFHGTMNYKSIFFFLNSVSNPAGNCMFKVNNRNTRTRCEICSKLICFFLNSFLYSNFSYCPLLWYFSTNKSIEKNKIYISVAFPAGIYLLKVNNRNTRTRCEICSKLTIKTPERR